VGKSTISMAMFNSFWYLYQSIPSAKILESAMAIFIHSKPPMWLTEIGRLLEISWSLISKGKGRHVHFLRSEGIPLNSLNSSSMVLEYESQHLPSKITQSCRFKKKIPHGIPWCIAARRSRTSLCWADSVLEWSLWSPGTWRLDVWETKGGSTRNFT